MAKREVWRDNRRIILQVGLLSACCGLAVWIRWLVASDALSDLASLILQGIVLLVFAGAAALAVLMARRACRGEERKALRLVPISLLGAAVAFATASYADVSVALRDLTAPVDASATRIVLGPGGHDVRLSGELTEGAAKALAALLDAHPMVERIHLTSDGGLSDEGEALASVIAAHKLTTFVPDYCVSACTLAFLGGRERLLMTGARLGFHAPYEEGMLGQTFAADKSEERAAYVASGVAPDFVDQALNVAPDDIWTPDADRLMAAHVATAVVGRYRFPDSNLDGMATLRGARDEVLRNFPVAKALEAKQPQDVDAIAAWYLDSYGKGASEGQIVDEIQARLTRALGGRALVLSVSDGPR